MPNIVCMCLSTFPFWNSFFTVVHNSTDCASSSLQSVLMCCLVLFILLSCIRKNQTMLIGGIFCGVGNCHIYLDFVSRISRTAMNPRINTLLGKQKSVCSNSPGFK